MKWPDEIPTALKVTLIAVFVAAALHMGFRIANDGNSILTLVEMICVFAYGFLIGPILVGPPTDD
jgi:hypothetical protein